MLPRRPEINKPLRKGISRPASEYIRPMGIHTGISRLASKLIQPMDIYPARQKVDPTYEHTATREKVHPVRGHIATHEKVNPTHEHIATREKVHPIHGHFRLQEHPINERIRPASKYFRPTGISEPQKSRSDPWAYRNSRESKSNPRAPPTRERVHSTRGDTLDSRAHSTCFDDIHVFILLARWRHLEHTIGVINNNAAELSTGRMDPRVGSGRVGSRFCRILAGRVGSALRIFKFFTDYFFGT